MTGAAPRWLALVGIGEDGAAGLSPAAAALVAQAELIVGGARHLALAAPLLRESRAETLAWPSPLQDAFPAILARRGRPVVVLVTGDPYHYGVGATLARVVPAEEMLCVPGPSAFSLAAARLGWALQETAQVSLHGRALERVVPHLQPGARVLALSWDGSTPARLASLLVERGMADTIVTVLERLGGPAERIRSAPAAGFALADIDPLNTIALEVRCGPDARVVTRAAGLPDELFAHDGQITKREIRAVTLSALAPRRGERLWDIGAGSGSVGIEWMLADPANRAIAVEADPARAARIAENAAALGVPDLTIVTGRAPVALAGLPRPEAVFVGGGSSDPAVLDAAWEALGPGGRIVVAAVTLEAQAEVFRRCRAQGGELTQVSVSRAEPVGGFLVWRPALPVVHWRAVKP